MAQLHFPAGVSGNENVFDLWPEGGTISSIVLACSMGSIGPERVIAVAES